MTHTRATGRTGRVHVILLNWNGWQDTVECLESLFALDYPDFQVLVCDNASTDGSLERIREWADGTLVAEPGIEFPSGRRGTAVVKPIEYVEYDRAAAERGGGGREAQLVLIQTGENLGYAGGNNVGLRYVLERGEPGYVWLLNNDVVVAPDSLRLLVNRAAADPDAVVGATLMEYGRPGYVETVGGGRITAWAGFPRATTAHEGAPRGTSKAQPVRLDFITGACLLTRVDMIARVGLIDERYFLYCEDTDWSFRAIRRGARLHAEPAALVWHKGGGTVGHRSTRHDYYIVKSSLLFVHRFKPGYLPLAVMYSVYRALLPKVIRGDWARAHAVLSGYRDFARQVHRAPEKALTFMNGKRR